MLLGSSVRTRRPLSSLRSQQCALSHWHLALCVSGDHMWASTVQLSYRPLPVRGDRTSRLYRLLTKLAAIATWRELRCSTVSDPGCKSAPHARRRSSEAAAEAYAADLRNALGDDGRLDLVLLGLGQDAHTASLFPGLAAVTEKQRTVMASYVEFVGMWRLTLTPPTINAARRVAFLVAGADKAGILHRVLQGPRQPAVLPAQAVRPAERPALWLIDAGAAARLKRS